MLKALEDCSLILVFRKFLPRQEAKSGSEATQTRPLDENMSREVLRSEEVLRLLRLLPVVKKLIGQIKTPISLFTRVNKTVDWFC